MSKPRILIVGSGAAAAVFARYLEVADCHVTFLVRNLDAPNAQMPRTLHQMTLRRSIRHWTQDVPCVTTPGEGWDQVWLCLPSTALEDPWLASRMQEMPQNTPVVSWTPDLKNDQRLATIWSGPISHGMISFVSFQSPLPNTDTTNTTEKGISYLLPPASAAVLSGDPAGQYAAALLRLGKMPVAVHNNLPWLATRASATLITLVSALECADWSLQGLRKDRSLINLIIDASHEAVRAAGAEMGARPLILPLIPRQVLIKSLLRIAPTLCPFPLEPYLEFHFSKVRDQTTMMLESWISLGEHHGMPTEKLQELLHRYDAASGQV